MTSTELLITVALVALFTIAIRALPFWIFPAGRKPPAFVTYLGRPLPAAVMAMLVVYCFKDLSFDSAAGFVPALAACALVVLLHRWQHRMILSIAGGTVAYMVLLRLLG